MTPFTRKVDELYAAFNKADSPGCALAIIKDGEVIYKQGYGMADLERNVQISPASIFDIASTGKQFTAMVIAILANQGVLSLDESISTYITEMPTYNQPITIRHLIYHTSGLRDLCTLMELSDRHFENYYSEDELLDLVCRQKELNNKPGDEFLYSNTGYFLLGVIAKRITGKSISELIRDIILEPLGMHATYCNDDAKRIIKNRAIGYAPKEGGGYCTEMSFFVGSGDGVILTSVEDLFIWDQNFYNNKLGGGGDELIQQILSPGVLNSGENLDYAFGLFVNDYRGLRKVSHSGWWVGYTAELMRFPEQKFSVICLTNLNSIHPTKLSLKVADLFLRDQYTELDQPVRSNANDIIELKSSQIDNLVGYYRNQQIGNIMKLSTQDGKIIGEIFGINFQLIATRSTPLKVINTPYKIQIDVDDPYFECTETLRVSFEGRKFDLYQKIVVESITPAHINAYVGEYYSNELNVLYKVLLDEGQLFIKRGYAPKVALQPITREIFLSYDLDFQFEYNEQNQVCTFRLGSGRVRNIRFIK
jgi:CubicO group peptidase (beta-lactamase class C family)